MELKVGQKYKLSPRITDIELWNGPTYNVDSGKFNYRFIHHSDAPFIVLAVRKDVQDRFSHSWYVSLQLNNGSVVDGYIFPHQFENDIIEER